VASIGRHTAYNWRSSDDAFAVAWDDALESGADCLEDIAFKRAERSSDTLLIFLLKARRPKKYCDKMRMQEHQDRDNMSFANVRIESLTDDQLAELLIRLDTAIDERVDEERDAATPLNEQEAVRENGR